MVLLTDILFVYNIGTKFHFREKQAVFMRQNIKLLSMKYYKISIVHF